MSEPLLHSPTSNTPSSATLLQVIKEQLVVVKAKCDAKGPKASGTTKSKATLALGKENEAAQEEQFACFCLSLRWGIV
jgi:hypothetical protein